jgi:23S rRNA pseudouridine2457 synthase
MLIAFHKPYGTICQFTPSGRKATLADFIDVRDVYPAGRLDTDSEGLLLLTDDGRLQAQIAEPKHKLAKTYWAQVEGVPSASDVSRLLAPLDLGDFISQGAREAKSINAPDVSERSPPIRQRANIPTSWLEITITEGKNRQVRRMTAKIGFPTLRLIRASIGALRLETLGLAVGRWCEIDPAQLGLRVIKPAVGSLSRSTRRDPRQRTRRVTDPSSIGRVEKKP